MSLQDKIDNFLSMSLPKTLLILIIVVTPRVLDLDVFYARDELAIWPWVDQFALAIWAGDLAGTLTTSDYPGVPMFWTQTLFLTTKYTFPALFQQTMLPLENLFDDRSLALLAERRLAAGLMVSLQIVAAVWLVRRLFGWGAALLTAIFMGLDPFSLSEARVLRLEMSSAMFVCLSLLAYFSYLRWRSRRWILISGLLAGLGVSTKTSAGLMVPYIWLLLGLDFFFAPSFSARRRAEQTRLEKLKQLPGNGLIWAAGAISAFWVIWPAMWVKPLEALQYLFSAGLGQAADRSVWGDKVFFWGQVLPGDPGPFFYPVVFAFRATPLTWLGVCAALLLLGLFIKRRVNLRGVVAPPEPNEATDKRAAASLLDLPPLDFQPLDSPDGASETRTTWPAIGVALLLAYIVLITVELSFIISKVDRFLLIVFPALNIVSALGFAALISWLVQRTIQWTDQHSSLRPTPYALRVWLPTAFLLIILAVQLNLTAAVHPHYFTYWNAWAGGGRTAMRLLPMGAGEGIDLAMNYLNSRPNADSARLVCGASHPWCARTFTGETLRSATYASGEWATADYVSFYISHLQRRNNPPEVVDFFMDREPLYQVDLQGATYVWVYATPDMGRFAGSWNDLAGLGRLLGYDVGETTRTAGETIEATIWWINRGAGVNNLVLRWVDETGYEWGRARVAPLAEYASLSPEKHAVVAGTAALTIPPGTPPGPYFLRIGATAPNEDKLLGEFTMPAAADQFVVEPGPPVSIGPDSLAIPTSVNQPLAPEVVLLGYAAPEQVLSAVSPAWLTLYWQATAQPADYLVVLRLLDSQGQETARWQGRPGHGHYPTQQWQAGEIVRDVWALPVEPDTPVGRYTLEISLHPPDQPDAPEQVFTIQDIEVWSQPLRFDTPQMQAELGVNFGDRLTLLGYDLYFDTRGAEDGRLTPNFYWRSQAEMEAAFELLLTLRAADTGRVVKTWQVPLGLDTAKTFWKAGEVVQTTYPLEAGTVSQGRYHLEIAVRRSGTGQPEPVNLEDGTESPSITIEDIQDKIVVRIRN